ncbi:hypothetical protein C0995_012503 [Termitomyces sp. Mi166|nr:hypothetical protein C0995_012503 [Termitomyces sp. Mi166\
MSSQNKTSASVLNTTSQPSQTKSESEATFTIQPHPATTNNPEDHRGKDGFFAHLAQGPGPVIPDTQMQGKIGEPLSKEELRVRAAELNK